MKIFTDCNTRGFADGVKAPLEIKKAYPRKKFNFQRRGGKGQQMRGAKISVFKFDTPLPSRNYWKDYTMAEESEKLSCSKLGT